jgi:drug/metabolite transporter (DMT)-like permease
MADNQKDKLIIWTAFLYLTLVWGSTFILNKRTLITFTAIQAASLRLTFAMSVMIWFVKPHLALVPKAKRFHLLISALTGICIPAYCFALAQAGLPSAMTGVLNAVTPCMTFILGIVFFRQSASWLKIVGLALGFIGSATIILVNAKGQLSLNSYSLWVILATILYGFNLNWVKKHLAEVPALPLATIAVTISGGIGFCILLTTNWLATMQSNPAGTTSFAAIATLGIFGTAVAQFFFARMLQVSSALFAGSVTYFVPIVAVAWGILDGEVLTWVHFLGILCIIGCILIISRFKN